jgi:hypothetical protein
MTGTYVQMSSAIMVKSGLVESKFQSEKAPMFGHLGRAKTVRKMYELWGFLLRNSLASNPSLAKYPFSINKENDFGLYEFGWESDLWEPFLKVLNRREQDGHMLEQMHLNKSIEY